MKMEPKTKVVYADSKDLNNPWITHIVIQTETHPPYVFGTYHLPTDEARLRKVNRLSDMLVIRADQAKRIFDFQPGNIEDCVHEKKGDE